MPRAAVARLTRRRYADALDHLAAIDDDLAAVVTRFGPPPLWVRPPGYATLVMIILEQQVSLQSARACFDKLAGRVGTVTPAAVLKQSDAALRDAGFSRQKAGYCRDLADRIERGALDLAALGRLPDDRARKALLAIRGIGPWTADLYLLMALRRPDIWPPGDLALQVAIQQVKRLRERPDARRFERLGRNYRPYRAVAARLLWHHYLGVRNRAG